MAAGRTREPFLLGQPVEIFRMIIDLLDEKDLNSLVRTCHTVHSQYNSFLYRRNVKYGKNTALEWAIYNTNPRTAAHALAAGAKVNRPLRDYQQKRELSSPLWDTPLMVAVHLWPASWTERSAECLRDHELLFNMLADHGADHGGVAGGLMMVDAAHKGCLRLANLLVHRARSSGWEMERMQQAMHEAAAHVDATELVELLIQNGWDVSARNANGMTPYGIAVESGNDAVAATLVMYGAELEEFFE